jgi:prevent-host-death family protein
MQKIMPLTDLKRTAGTVLADLSESGKSVVITRRGRPAAVLVSIERYQEMETYAAQLVELELVELVRKGGAAIEAGEAITHEEVKARLLKKYARGNTRSRS